MIVCYILTNCITALAPTFTKWLTDQSISIGEQLILFCAVYGIPQPTVEFYRDNVQMKSSKRMSVEHDVTNKYWRLLIKETCKEDFGMYRAVAKNTIGAAISTAKVSPKVVAPTFEQGLKSTKVTEKEEIRMEQDYMHEIRQDVSSNTYSLIIRESQISHTGKYTVKATNLSGTAESSADVEVTQKTRMPSLIRGLVFTEVKVNETATMSVNVTGAPAPEITWKKDDKPLIIDGTHITSTRISEYEHSLTIHSCTVQDVGLYTCEATNTAGSELHTVQIKESESFDMTVTVTGSPTPKVEWFKDDVPIEVDNVHILTKEEGRGQFTLTIKDAKVTDIGSYSCKATSIAGEARTEATVNVTKETAAPQFVEVLRPVHVKETETINLTVTVTGSPTPKVEWFKDDVPIEVDNVHILTKEEGRGQFTLTIKDAKVTDIGSYSCKATSIAGEARTEATVNVTKETAAPQFVEVLRPIHIKETETINLTVTVTGSPTPKVEWFKDDVPIEVDNVHILTKEEGRGQFTLTIKDAKVTDIGSYSCKATSIAGEARTEATVNVTKETAAPQFVEVLRPIHIKETETINLTVTVTGSPTPKVEWFKDDVPIEVDNVHILTKEEGRGQFTLTIKDAKVTDIGSYSCKATSIAGEARTEAKVEVEIQRESESLAPTFTKSLVDQSISIGDQLVLFCSVKGAPQPTVEFYREGIRIKSSTRISIEHDKTNTHWRVLIKESTQEDFGKYRALAKNTVGTAISEATVSTRTDVPVFEQGLKRTTVKEKEEIHMEVKVSGTQPEVSWFKDGQPIEQDMIHEIRQEASTGIYSLTVKEAAMTDAGRYTVKATNIAGSVESSAEVEVTQSFEKPSFVKELVSTEVKVNQTATLSVTVKGVPAPDVTWKKDGQPVNIDNTHIVSKKESDGVFSITISSARIEDAGKYTCEATNVAGSAECSANFAVVKDVEAPQFTEKLQPLEVKQQESATLSVTVTGSPEPKIAWFKDAVPIQIDNVHLFAKDEGSGHYVLTIKEARITDQGSYSCKATNEAGEARTEATVHVAKESIGPQFTETLKPLEVKETETLNLSVTVTGSPSPTVKWFKDDVPIQIDNVHVLSQDEGHGHFTLTIRDARVSDVGSYSCKATNEAGEARTEATVHVAKESIGPQFTETLQPLEVKETETLNLSVTVTGSPSPTVKWFKDDVPIQIDNVHVLSQDEGPRSLHPDHQRCPCIRRWQLLLQSN
ncbi:immunoglobulin I-set domain protein [Cooperia oncophora]